MAKKSVSRIGSKPLTDANQIRVQRLHREARSWRILGELVVEAAKEAGVEHPTAYAAAQTARVAARGGSISEWSMNYMLPAINRLDDKPVTKGNGKHTPPTDKDKLPTPTTLRSAKEVQVIEDWKQRYEDKREENVRLQGELRGAHAQIDQLSRELAQMRIELEGVKHDAEDYISILQESVLSDEGDFLLTQVKAARLLIAKQISEEQND